MSTKTETPRTRRALLTAALGAGAATVVAAVTRPLPVNAASGSFDSSDAGTSAVSGVNTATSGYGAHGVFGESDSTNGNGVFGIATAGSGQSKGVYGETASTDGWAIYGHAVSGTGGTTGVYGGADSASGVGVSGWSNGVGVQGNSDGGTGVLATTTTGVALQVAGKAKFSRSGRASVPKGKLSVDVVVPGGLAATSVVHATLQAYHAGVGIAAVRANYPTAGKARIYLTKVASLTAATPVGWFVAEH